MRRVVNIRFKTSARGAPFFMALLLVALLLSCAVSSYRPSKTPQYEDPKAASQELFHKMRRAFEHAVGCEGFEVGLRGFAFSGRYVKDAGFTRTPKPKMFKRGLFDDRTLTPAETEVWEQRLVIFDNIVDIEAKDSLFGFSSEGPSPGCVIPGQGAKSVVIFTLKRGRVCIGFESMAAAKEFADAAAGLAGLGSGE